MEDQIWDPGKGGEPPGHLPVQGRQPRNRPVAVLLVHGGVFRVGLAELPGDNFHDLDRICRI